MTTTVRTRVAIVGAGPAGLLLSHLLADAGHRVGRRRPAHARARSRRTIRAGILEQGTVEMLDTLGEFSRARTVGTRHDGIELRFAGDGHRIDFPRLVGRSVWLYPQHEALKDLIAARLAGGQDLRFGVTVERVEDAESALARASSPPMPTGSTLVIEADFVVGADGSRSVVRAAVTGSSTGGYFREYPFAWFGILTEAPPSAHELIYSNSPDGFALISQRSPTVQRMYFQCDPEADPNALTEAEIWETLQARVPGTTLTEGPIFQRDVLRFRSFVAHELRKGRARDRRGCRAHRAADRREGHEPRRRRRDRARPGAAGAAARERRAAASTRFAETALHRIWKAQHFSWWMTSMLHVAPDATDFDRLRQLGELRIGRRVRGGSHLPRRGVHGLAAGGSRRPGLRARVQHGPDLSEADTRLRGAPDDTAPRDPSAITRA